ncbi:MAG: recombination protein O N-terminal domain-containing protein [Candidatus Paceibacterota bacterium]|jgi:DNA repair protein RecO (recombination protein O)
MKEFYTRALVLGRRDINEVDGLISLFTQDYGKIVARAKSIRKIKSKLSAHIQPLNFIKVRLIKLAGPRDGFSIIDCVRDEDLSWPEKRFDMLPILGLIDSMAFELQTDRKLWAFMVGIMGKKFEYSEVTRALLLVLGFDPKEGECFSCHSKDIFSFHKHDHIFLCKEHSLKIPQDKVILLT